MPRGKYVNHKGRGRRFTNPDELEEQRRKEEEEKRWRKEHGGEDLSEEDSDESSGSDSDESGEEVEPKAKGVSNLIEIDNPNRVVHKPKKLSQMSQVGPKLSQMSIDVEPPQLSRREREEIERQREQERFEKLHAAGKTDKSRADLARLAIIKQKREEAAKARELEKQKKEEAAKARAEQIHKATGKKG